MRRRFPLPLMVALFGLVLTSCTQNTGGGFSESPSPVPTAPTAPAQLDLRTLAGIRAAAVAALGAHLHGGVPDLSWGGGAAAQVAGPYADAPPEADAMALEAIRSLAVTPAAGGEGAASQRDAAAAATAQAFKQLDGPRGGAFLLLVDGAHPLPPAAPAGVDPTPTSCSTPNPTSITPDCLSRQVTDGLYAAWYAADTRMFFKAGETSTIYRPVDALAVGAALVVGGFRTHEEAKIQAGSNIIQREMKTDLDGHFGMLAGLVTATAAGGHEITDYNTRLADQAGAAEILLEAFDASREQQYMADAQKLLQPFLDERVQLRAGSGGYLPGFDLQSSGPPDHGPSDLLATLLVLQAARHYDRDDGDHFARLEETAAAAVTTVVGADRKQGGDPAAGLPAGVPESGFAARSGLVTALAVVVLGDVARDLGRATASPAASSSP